MKKVLYLTNIEVPYRVQFFNQLAESCDLTVLYETRGTGARDKVWAKSVNTRHRAKFLQRRRIFFSEIMKEICNGYDSVIVGCYNSQIQIVAMFLMRLRRIPYIINLDGEPFLEGNSLKSTIKRFVLSGAEKYLVAGEKTAHSLVPVAGNKKVIPYYFSSLSEQELQEHWAASEQSERNDTILVVGQYFDYKGMDVALKAAQLDQSLHYKFVGMGTRTEQFWKDFAGDIPSNVEIVPFLQKEELEKEYASCAMLLLPSRQECWGLVINEAASFGTPIVSTWGSGAAVEFLSDHYQQYLAKTGDAEDLLRCIRNCLHTENLAAYQRFLLKKSKDYTIEKGVQAHLSACDIFTGEK